MTTTPPPPATPPAYVAPATGPRTNTLAIVALILGILVPIGGIITGHIALSQIKKSGEAGHGLALAGTIIGYVLTVGYILIVILTVIAAAVIGTASVNSTNY